MGRGPVSDSSPWEPLYQQVGRLFLTVVAAMLVVMLVKHAPSHSLIARSPQEALYLFRRQGSSVSLRVGMGRSPSNMDNTRYGTLDGSITVGLIRQVEVFETPYAASSRMPPSGPQLFVRAIATLLQADVMLLWTGVPCA